MKLDAFLDEVLRLVQLERPHYAALTEQAREVSEIYYAAGADPDQPADEIVIAALEGKDPVL